MVVFHRHDLPRSSIVYTELRACHKQLVSSICLHHLTFVLVVLKPAVDLRLRPGNVETMIFKIQELR